jgi:two-component system, OmpR family, sensor kinase
MSPPPPSIRTRLMRLQWLALLLVGGVCGVVSFGLTWRTVNDLRDHTLEQVAQSVVRHGLEVEGDDNAPDVPDKGQFTSQIWTDDGQLHYTSAEDGPPRQQPGWQSGMCTPCCKTG